MPATAHPLPGDPNSSGIDHDSSLLDGMSEGMIFVDQADCVLRLNTAASQLLGVPAAEVVGRDAAGIAGGLLQPALQALRAGAVDREILLPRTSQVRALAQPFRWAGGGGLRLREAPEPDRAAAPAEPDDPEAERQRLYRLQMEAPAIIAVLEGPEHVFSFVNLAYQRAVGRTQEELLGRKVRDALPEFAGLGFFELLDQVFTEGKSIIREEMPGPPRPGGGTEPTYYSFVYQPAHAADGSVNGVLLHAWDESDCVSARKSAEAFAREAETERARLHALIEKIPAGIMLAEAPSGRVLLANRRAEEICRRPMTTFEGVDSYGQIAGTFEDGRPIAPEDWPLARTLRGEVIDAEECILQRADGTPVWIRVSGTPVYGPDGAVTNGIVSFIDIDEEKNADKLRSEAEAALAESEWQFRLIADAMPQLVWTARPDGHHDYFNRRWYEYTGVAPGDTDGEGWSQLLHPDDVPSTLARWKDCLDSGEPYQVEYRFRGISGNYRWFLGRAVPLRDSAGRITRWFGTCTDIEDQKQSEAALRRSNEDLEQFAYAASHDLQEPLRMVAIYSQLLKRRYSGRLDASADLYIDHLVSGAQRMELLLNDLRSYIQAANLPPGPRPSASTDAGQILAQVREDLAEIIERSNAVLTAPQLPVVAVDGVHMHQLLQNLIANAIKYRSEAPPEIHVGVQRAGADWIFSVSDNGIGIDPRYGQHVFGVFKRLHGQKYPGTGIGLAICQKIVERYGGSIWVKSERGRGATFFFTVPAAEETGYDRRR